MPLPELSPRARSLLGKLTLAREDLRAMLSPEELRTKRAWGSALPTTFEDRASASQDPEIALALSRFQEALGEAWLEVGLGCGLADAALGLFRAKRKDRRDGEELHAEAMWGLRDALIRVDVKRPQTPAALVNWMVLEMLQAMGLARAQLDSPVELPQREARKFRGMTNSPLNDESQTSNEEDA